MSKVNLHLTAILFGILVVPTYSTAQITSCGPSVAYDATSDDSIIYISATCMRDMTLGPLSAGALLGFGFGSYDYGGGFDGSYNAFKISGIVSYPYQISEDSPLEIYGFGAPGFQWWWEDCSSDDCSDSDFIIDLGGGVQYNMFGAEVYGIVGGFLDWGIRLKALLPVGGS